MRLPLLGTHLLRKAAPLSLTLLLWESQTRPPGTPCEAKWAGLSGASSFS